MIDRTDLFKISILALGRKEIVTSLYSSLVGQRQRQTEREREKLVGHMQSFIQITTREIALPT